MHYLLRFSAVVIILTLSCQIGVAQKWEFGLGAGTLLYKGELSDTYNPINAAPALAPFVRVNFENAFCLRMQATLGQIKSGEKTTNNLYFNQINPTSFKQTVAEAALLAEYNFLDFRRGRLPDKYSPYIFGGVAMLFNDASEVEAEKLAPYNFTIPFGLGYKLALGRYFTLGAEAGFRKTFTGLLDGRSDQIATTVKTVNKIKYYSLETQRGYTEFTDWYAFFGVTLSYTMYRIHCPEDDHYKAH
jgi:hypothetical protein